MHGRPVPKKAAQRYNRLFRRRAPMRVTTIDADVEDEQNDAADVEREVGGADDDDDHAATQGAPNDDEDESGPAPTVPPTPAADELGETSSESARSTPSVQVVDDEDDEDFVVEEVRTALVGPGRF